MSTELWTSLTSQGTVLTATELNALADAAYSVVGTQIDNQTYLAVWGVLRLSITFGSAPTDESVVEFYQHCALDGTNFADGSTSGTTHPGVQLHCCDISVDDHTNAQLLDSAPFRLLPGKLKFSCRNRTGAAFPAAPSVTLYTFNRQFSG